MAMQRFFTRSTSSGPAVVISSSSSSSLSSSSIAQRTFHTSGMSGGMDSILRSSSFLSRSCGSSSRRSSPSQIPQQKRFYNTPSKRALKRFRHKAGQYRLKPRVLPQESAGLGEPIRGPVIPWEAPQLEVWVHNWQQKPVGILPLSREVWGQRIRKDIVHRVVVYQRAKRRFGNAKTKTRAEVSGGTRKPWPQKGTGRARHGSNRSPLWRKGGKAHGPVVKSWEHSLPKKIRSLGLKIALSAKYAEGNLFVINNLNLKSHRTRHFRELFDRWQMHNSILMYSPQEIETNLLMAVKNIPGVNLMKSTSASVVDILQRDTLFISLQALRDLETRLSPEQYNRIVFNANVPEEILRAQEKQMMKEAKKSLGM